MTLRSLRKLPSRPSPSKPVRPDQAAAPLSLTSLHVPESLPVSVPTELLHQRPDILAAEAAVRAAADEAGAATASMFPSLSLSARMAAADSIGRPSPPRRAPSGVSVPSSRSRCFTAER